MRYQHLRYRYARVILAAEPRPLSSLWPGEPRWVSLAQPRWRPPTDVYETPTAITIVAELAGVDPEELEILLFDDAVVVEGQRRLVPPEDDAIYHSAEINQGRFRLAVELPAPVDAGRVDSRYERGLLRITLAKAVEG